MLTEEDACNLAMRMVEPVVRNMTDEEFDEFQDRLYEALRALYESDQLAKYLPIPAPERPVYVTRDNDLPKLEGSAPRSPEDEDDPETDPSPELLAADQLQADQNADSQTEN